VSNPTEVKLAFVPVAEEAPVPAQEFARVKGEKETAEARVTELERQLAEAKQKPAAMSAHQEVQESEAGAKTGNRGLDNISRIMSAK
jgi:hypothetical protein